MSNYIKEFTYVILDKVEEDYYGARNPQGWVLGEVVVEYLKDYWEEYQHITEKEINEDGLKELYGLPVIVDHKNKQRIELVE